MYPSATTLANTGRFLICETRCCQFHLQCGQEFAVDTQSSPSEGALILADVGGELELAVFHGAYIIMQNQEKEWIFEVIGPVVES